jgi:hypothetical protein
VFRYDRCSVSIVYMFNFPNHLLFLDAVNHWYSRLLRNKNKLIFIIIQIWTKTFSFLWKGRQKVSLWKISEKEGFPLLSTLWIIKKFSWKIEEVMMIPSFEVLKNRSDLSLIERVETRSGCFERWKRR